MTSIVRSELRLPAAGVGPADPLPLPDTLLEAPFELSADVPEEIREGARVGRPASVHPYLMQNRYTRERHETSLPSVVLDNGLLRATFVPSLGGRLWSLTDAGRELLHANPVLQPANLALRNAWFAGGVEWNIGTKGHTVHTMAPLHAATLEGPDGAPVLRMWEFDRLREVVFQVDAWLPAGSRALLVYVRIQNTSGREQPMYWWSNAAVPQGEDVRVLVPADRAYATSYDGSVRSVPVPVHEGVDRTWPTRNPDAADFFYDTAGVRHPWIAAVDASGHGLAQVSTNRLVGRKLFCWGTGPGGRRWQEWLSPGSTGYLEIQAGLRPTQFEHAAMPAGASWDWVEAYGDLAADGALVHTDEWARVTAHAAQRVHEMVGGRDLDRVLVQARATADRAPAEVLSAGSGWGALEVRRRAVSGDHWTGSPGTPFPAELLGPEQEPWDALLTDPHRAETLLAEADPGVAPSSYVVGPHWEDALAALPAGWLRDYHLGVMAHHRGALDEADRHYGSSLHHRPTAWALRGRATLASRRGDHAAAADLLAAAVELVGDQPTLLLEATSAALRSGEPDRALALVDGAPPALQESGRLRLLEGYAALAAGRRERAERVLAQDVAIADLREGEVALSDLWMAVHPDDPVPARYDFRMRRPQA